MLMKMNSLLKLVLVYLVIFTIRTKNKHVSCYERPRFVMKNYCTFDNSPIDNSTELLKTFTESDYIFTGKINSEIDVNDEKLNFNVSVKRLLKGNYLTNSFRVLYVNGDRNCTPRLRVGDSAIFLGVEQRRAHVRLILQPVPLTVHNLNRMNAAGKELNYQPRPIILKEPCAKTYCAWGAICIVGADGRAHCQCPASCDQPDPTTDTSVCGSDGITYPTRCHLRRTSCLRRLNMRVRHTGQCNITDTELADPCRGVTCGPGARCVASADGRNAHCACPQSCPSYGDHAASRPVCGSDARDYRDRCELRRRACETNTNITVKFEGKCDPCSETTCPEPEVCQLDVQRNPVCRCGDACPLEFTPVCGSDGKTYSNECALRQEACRTRRPLRIVHRGKCSSAVNPCSSTRCSSWEECTINKYGIARCECPTDCEPVMRPVCSKDGRTFTSECELRKTACNTRTTIDIAYSGVCDKAGPCSEHQCKWGAQCVEHGLVAQCECPSCPTEFQPVCGSDGISYSNECKLRLEACNHQRDISVLYDGPCNGCENKKCDFYSTCESDGLSEAQCVCPKTCDNNKDNSPVCGTDGVTYDSECHLKVASCETKQYVIVAYHGHCDLCKDIECKFGAHCKAGECVCPKDCTDSGIEAVCASNMVTFTNECELKKASCLLPENSQPLNVIFYGDCRERFAVVPDPIALRMEVKPCNGEKPLVDPVTQKELDCGSGANRQDCPSDSYCHQTTRFARCCQKSQKVSPKSCEDSWFGCCPDGKTPAQGVDHAGCPSQCSCHRLGSFDDTCDPETGQCHCRPGVGGLKCDRCEPGYWGLPKISSGHHGCLPCGCSSFGSVRDDCEQMTGRCVCKPEIQGQKCTVCTSHDKVLGPNGCVAVDRTTPPPSTCKELNCHFGAICTERRGLAICECHSECGNETPGSQQVVCGSDGQTYESECQLRLLACRHQKDIVVYAFGPCKGTDWPIGRYTPMQFTQPDEQHSPLSKSTRHLLTPDSRYYYSRYSPSTGNWENSGFKETDLITGISFNAHAAYRPTPATVRVLTALLGDICSEDTDCLIQNSICIGSACTCRQGFVESLDRQECLAHSIPMTTTEESRACISSPCFGDSTCIDLPSATFTCVCGTNFTGPQCEHEVNLKAYEIPSFDGTSYIKLKTIKAYHKLNMEIELKTYDDDGIIFYNQQKTDGSGDFISLAIINGYIEFRYNLGNGVVKIVSLKKIEKFKYHRIIIKRYHRDGILKIDDGDDVAGHSPGKLRALDLKDDAFIGYITLNISKIYENIGTANGFNGCIRKLKINHRLIEMQPGSDELVIDTHRIQECGENPCAHLRCLNGATCHSHGTESYHCVCTEDFTGKYCESRLDQCTSSPCKHGSTCESLPNGKYYCKCLPGRIGPKCEEIVFNHNTMIIPEFNGSSFIEYPKLEGVGKEFSVEIWFLSFSSNGLILYSGQHKKGTGDFVAVNLVNKHLQFRFNLGSGICNITSKETIELFKWHQVKINRYEREGTLQVNNGSLVRGFSGPSLIELNLELPLYIGSIPMWNQIHRLSGATKGFRGAIQRIILNGKEIPILHTKACLTGHILSKNDCKSHHVSKYTGFPCSSMKNPCFNGGTCVPILNDYICKCVSDDYEGAQCENALHMKKAVKFSGKTFLQYRNKKNSHFINNSSSGFLITDNEEEMYDEEKDDYETDDGIILDYDLDEYSDSEILGRKGERVNKYQIRFRTLDSEGLILWRSKNRSLYRHYLAIAIVDGYPEFSYNLGKQNDFWSIRYPKKINDGAWHTIVARRQKRTGHISIDGDKAEKGISWPGAVLFNGSPRIWIGGSPGLPAGLPISYYTGFRGCIQYVKINNKPLDLWKDRASVLQYCHENQV